MLYVCVCVRARVYSLILMKGTIQQITILEIALRLFRPPRRAHVSFNSIVLSLYANVQTAVCR